MTVSGILRSLDRKRFTLAILALLISAGLVAALGYTIAMALDSMYIMVGALVAAGLLFASGGTVLVWHRFRTMGYGPLPATTAYAVAVFFAFNLVPARFPVSLMAIPFLAALAAPFVLKGQKKSPGDAGDSE
ncbi:MAG TPA: hypothetical protein PKW21_06685 [Rhabdaerophilum sp.]|nr:hypothetical protein [Rhabdaerophilum sp.]